MNKVVFSLAVIALASTNTNADNRQHDRKAHEKYQPSWSGKRALHGNKGGHTDLETRITALEEKLQTLGDSASADLESPEILIKVPANTLGDFEKVKVTYTDNRGLFKVASNALQRLTGFNGFNGVNVLLSPVSEVLYESELEVVRESSIIVPFGGEYVVRAYATDLAGNSSTATSTISSDVGISVGQYKLDEPLNEIISGSGCQLQYADRLIKAETIHVSGSFKPNLDEQCAYYNINEPENAVACISVGLALQEYNGLGGSVVGAITSIEDTEFSANTGGTSGSGGGDNYKAFTQMDVEFFNTTPATVAIDMTLKCESTAYGTTTFGPYQLHGTLEQ